MGKEISEETMDERNIKVSIIIPIYNVVNDIERCLNSLINQTFRDFEVILINDGSTDGSLEKCREFEQMDHRILVIDKAHEGISIARNKGLDIAKGRYICFVDGDDYVELNAIEEMYHVIQSKNTDIVLFNHYRGKDEIEQVKFPKNKVLYKDELKKILKKANTDFFIPFLWRNIYKNTKRQKQIRFKEKLKYGEDSLYNLESYLHAESIYCSDHAYYHYMPNRNSTMNSEKKDFLISLNHLYEEKMRVYDSMNLNEYKIDLYQYTIQHTLSLLIYEIFQYKQIRHYREFLMEVGSSKMVQESLGSDCVDIDKLNISKLYKTIIKCIKKRKYRLAAIFLALSKVYGKIKFFLIRARRKVLNFIHNHM